MAVQHDYFCPAGSWARAVQCTCGAEEAQRIVDETSAAFGRDLKRIMAGDDHCDQCAGPCLRRPRHAQGWA